MLVEIFLGSGLSLAAAHLYRFSRRRALEKPKGMSKAASLLMELPPMTANTVLARLDGAMAQELSQFMSIIARLPPRARLQLAQRSVQEVFLQVEPFGESQKEAWSSLAQSDPALAASICRHFCRQDS